MPDARRWDPKLYQGSAPYYARGRLPYPPEMASVLGDELGLVGTGRLLDVGCGPGSVTLLLAPLFREVVGIDPDPGMIAEAESEAARGRIDNARWVQMSAEALPADLGIFQVATFAQSFHWLDREAVAATVADMLEPGGSWVHINATTHEGVDGADDLPGVRGPTDEAAGMSRWPISSPAGPVAVRVRADRG